MFLPYVLFVFLCMSEVTSSFMSLRARSQVFVLLMLFLYVILHTNTMWLGKSLKLLYILACGRLCVSAIKMMSVKIILEVCMLVGIVV